MPLEADTEASSSSTTTEPSSLSEPSSPLLQPKPSPFTADTEPSISSPLQPPPAREEALLCAPQAPPPAPSSSPPPPRARLAFNRGRDLEDDFIPDTLLADGEGERGFDNDDEACSARLGVSVDLTDGHVFDNNDDDDTVDSGCFACTWTSGDGGDDELDVKNDADAAELVVGCADFDVSDLTSWRRRARGARSGGETPSTTTASSRAATHASCHVRGRAGGSACTTTV